MAVLAAGLGESVLVQHWGQLLGQYWDSTEAVLGKYWGSTGGQYWGAALGQYWDIAEAQVPGTCLAGALKYALQPLKS